MRSYPQTIDVAAQPTELSAAVVPQTANSRLLINQSLGADAYLLVGSLLMGILCSGVASLLGVDSPTPPLMRPLPWFAFLVCLAPSLWVLLVDTLMASSRPDRLPFAYVLPRTKAIYAKRLHLALVAVYFAALSVAFCWSVPAMPIFSKLFVAAVFAIAFYALGQSIPSRRKSLVIPGLLFLVTIVVIQLFVLAGL